jgi:transaldolase
MSSPLRSLIESGTKLWLDSIDPDLVTENRKLGATGATSNPIIVADLVKSGRFDADIDRLVGRQLSDEQIAWQLTDQLVTAAQRQFEAVWRETGGNDGYVSFELDPLLEDPQLAPPHQRRVARYIELGRQWAAGHTNRMIKVPATPAGLEAIEELAAAGVTINLTLVFSRRQYRQGRDAIWRGAQRRGDGLSGFKSVYSIFVSRVDVYAEKAAPQLSSAAQGQVGIVNAKRIWAENQEFWADKGLAREQEIIFASTGTKRPEDPPWKYVEAFAGSGIETNPPATNEAVEASGRIIHRSVDGMPPADILAEIDREVDEADMENTLMEEGVRKFADPHKALLQLIAEKRATLAQTG